MNKNLIANGFGEAHNCALGSSNGQAEFFVPDNGDVYGTLKPNGYVSSDALRLQVELRRMDDLLEESNVSRVDCINIDVEGAEMDVLKGSLCTLEKYCPNMIVEYGLPTWSGFGYTFPDLMEFTDKIDYEIFIYDRRSKKLRRPVSQDHEAGYINLVLLHKKNIANCSIGIET